MIETHDPGASTPGHLLELRHDLHRHPELRFAEHRTAGILAERLAALGYRVRRGVGGTGVVGVLDGDGPGPCLLLRADMDALPVVDRTVSDHTSSTAGASHACGHDVHMVVVLGVAERLATHGIARGRVVVAFQPAEERPFGERSGAQAMLDDGLFADGEPSAVLGLHCWPDLSAGEMGVDERIAMGAKDAFSVELRGRGAHAATPSRGQDAVLGVGALITELHAGIGRALDATDRAAFNIGTVAGGRSQSVVADEAMLTGTLRTVDPEVRARLRAVIERITSGIAAAHGLVGDLRWADEMPPVRNDQRLVGRAIAIAEGSGIPIHVLSDPPMTADDFALLAAGRPALYLKLGVRDPESVDWPPLHSSLFDVDDRCIGVGIRVLSRLALDLLDRGPDEPPVAGGTAG